MHRLPRSFSLLAPVLGGAMALSTGLLSPAATAAPSAATVSDKAVDRLVDRLSSQTASPKAYRQARDALLRQLQQDPSLRAEFLATADALDVTDASFDRDVLTLIVAARLRNADADAQLSQLDGLTASHYLKRRRPRAGAVKELVRRQVPAPLLYERLAFTQDQAFAQTSPRTAFTRQFAKEADAWIEKEKAGHIEALVHALGESRSAIAPFALLRHLRDATGADEATTLLALGKTRSPSLIPTFVAAIDGKNADARQTAVVALGLLRDVDATRVLAARTRDADASIRLAAIRGLGAAASVRAKDAGQPDRLVIALDALIPLLDNSQLTKSEARAVVQTLSQLPSDLTRSRLAAATSERASVVRARLDRKSRRLQR